MVMREQLQQIIASGKPWAAERARMALAMTEALERGELGQAEYQELMQDLIRSDVLNAQADDQDLKNLLVSCVMIGAKLA
jgi:polyhydroxyalkanoate synthesis regulator phasin